MQPLLKTFIESSEFLVKNFYFNSFSFFGADEKILYRPVPQKEKGQHRMRFKVLKALNISTFLWIVTPCGFIGRYQRFGGIY